MGNGQAEVGFSTHRWGLGLDNFSVTAWGSTNFSVRGIKNWIWTLVYVRGVESDADGTSDLVGKNRREYFNFKSHET